MGKTGGFWDKANRKLVGDEKMDLLNAKRDARNEKLDQKLEGLRIESDKNKQNNKQAEDGIYPGISGNDLFNATMMAAANRKYSIESSDKAGLTVTFQTHKSETYWDGKLSCFILEVGGMARVTVSGSENRGSTESGFGPGSTFSDNMKGLASKGAFVGELKKFKREIFQEVATYPISDITEATMINSPTDLANQLVQLKTLFDSGALTADQFEKAKAKLLG
jgi:hypothetical protein